MVVGDDAQAIYSFRAATVRNILDFPDKFKPRARVITLEQNCSRKTFSRNGGRNKSHT
jgi:superfamily I DNA/RNA helicase